MTLSMRLSRILIGVAAATTWAHAATVWAEPAAEPAAAPRDPVAMVAIPEGCIAVESRKVCVSGYRIDRTEVTVGQFRRCVAAGACKAPDRPRCASRCGGHEYFRKQEDRPITAVKFEQAVAYCAWAGKRLPSEAEWTRAALGTEGRRFPWGGQPPSCERAAIKQCLKPSDWSAPVCSRPAGNSQEGVCDLYGNAKEWVDGRVYMGSDVWVGTNDVGTLRHRFPGGTWGRHGFRCAVAP
jgi:formylglycine-generating enzyme required for sulfatase activity